MQKLSPNEKMSDLLRTAENSLNANETTDQGKCQQGFKKSAVVPDDESVL